MKPFLIRENFFSVDECRSFIREFHDNSHLVESAYVNESDSMSELLFKNIHDVLIHRLNGAITEYLDPFQYVNIGCYYFSHAVIWKQSEFYRVQGHYDSEWVPEKEGEQPIRNFACLVYLNENYEGGEILFPLQNLTLKPKTGTLLIFPTSYMFPHMTTPSIGDDRYVMRFNYYFDKNSKSQQFSR